MSLPPRTPPCSSNIALIPSGRSAARATRMADSVSMGDITRSSKAVPSSLASPILSFPRLEQPTLSSMPVALDGRYRIDGRTLALAAATGGCFLSRKENLKIQDPASPYVPASEPFSNGLTLALHTRTNTGSPGIHRGGRPFQLGRAEPVR